MPIILSLHYKVACYLNDKSVERSFAGRYLLIFDLKPNDTIRLEFPVQGHVDTYHLIDRDPEGEEAAITK